MQENHVMFKGILHSDGGIIAITAEFASKYSFFITCSNGDIIRHREEFENLSLIVDGEIFNLGRCQMLIEPNIDGYTGQLIFTQSIYDLENLFSNKKLVNLQSDFINLPLVISHKDKIDSTFKNYVADLTYDLSVYKGFFDNADNEIENEPAHIKDAIQKALLSTEGRDMMAFLDKKLDEFEGIIQAFDRKAHERHGFYLRKQILHFLMSAPFMARANLKPRGYAGDSVMMSMIYENDYRGNSTFGKIMHKHPIEHPAASAVRSRRSMISDRLKEILKNYQGVNKVLKILSVACGPALELCDIVLSPKDSERFNIVLFDQDKRALMEAAENVTQIEKTLGIRLKTKYLNESVRTMLATPMHAEQIERFDFIYSMGLFDYLTPPVAKAVIKKLFQMLEPGGELIIGNFYVSNPSQYYMEYWLDWVLYHRTEEEFRQLIDISIAEKIEILFEDTRSQMFLSARKRA